MTPEQNLDTARRMIRAFDEGGWDGIQPFLAPDVVAHFPGAPGPLDRAAMEPLMRGLVAAFPDMDHEVLDAVAEGDRVALRILVTGTHAGELQGLAPTGRPLRLPVLALHRYADGRLAEEWIAFDQLEMLGQLGAAPRPGEAEANAAAARALYHAFNAREFDRGAGLIAGDARWIDVPTGRELHGPDGWREWSDGWTAAFPDARAEIRSLAAAGDVVCVEFVGRGTHGGPLATPAGTLPATGRPVDVPFCDVIRFRDGRIVEGRTYYDAATFLRQLGLDAQPLAAAG